jgi:hypothetical protein
MIPVHTIICLQIPNNLKFIHSNQQSYRLFGWGNLEMHGIVNILAFQMMLFYIATFIVFVWIEFSVIFKYVICPRCGLVRIYIYRAPFDIRN